MEAKKTKVLIAILVIAVLGLGVYASITMSSEGGMGMIRKSPVQTDKINYDNNLKEQDKASPKGTDIYGMQRAEEDELPTDGVDIYGMQRAEEDELPTDGVDIYGMQRAEEDELPTNGVDIYGMQRAEEDEFPTEGFDL